MKIGSMRQSPLRGALHAFRDGFWKPGQPLQLFWPGLSTSDAVAPALLPQSFLYLHLNLNFLTRRLAPGWVPDDGLDFASSGRFMSLWWPWITSTAAWHLFPLLSLGGDPVLFTWLSVTHWGLYWLCVIGRSSSQSFLAIWRWIHCKTC